MNLEGCSDGKNLSLVVVQREATAIGDKSENSSQIPTLSLSLLRSRLVKLADNLYQAANALSVPNSSINSNWESGALERINMALSHLDTLEANELQEELGKGLLVEPLVPTPNPNVIPCVLLRTKAIPECEQEWIRETSKEEQEADFSTDQKRATISLHNEITQRDEMYLELLEWLEERKQAFHSSVER